MTERASVLVVGASVAAGALVSQLRSEGHQGRIVVIDRDPDAPYDRPPLSKSFMTSDERAPEAAWWSSECELAVASAEHLDLRAGAVTVERPDGSTDVIVADDIVIATGGTPARIPHQPDGVLQLRTAADARSLRRHARSGAQVVVLGAGTIGTEIASSLTAAGASVSLIDLAQRPLQRFLGGHLGEEVTQWLVDGGVELHLGRTVYSITHEGGDWVVTTDHGSLRGDAVVSAVGTRPAVAWLEHSGLGLDDGVLCDHDGNAITDDGAVLAGVHAIGDVARWSMPDGSRRRREDWTSAQRQGRHVARKLAGLDPLASDTSAPDYFWSNQFGRRVQVLGTPPPGAELVCEVEDPTRQAAFYTLREGSDTVAWISINRPREFAMALREASGPVGAPA